MLNYTSLPTRLRAIFLKSSKSYLNLLKQITNILPRLIFFSRWLQAPLYLGLIIALIIYIGEFTGNVYHLAFNSIKLNETQLMLNVLDLIDIVMIANLLIMVIIGGYQTFISRLNLTDHRDKPEWLEEVNAGTMKIKLALALIGISSIHLLRTFMDPQRMTSQAIMWQVAIHITLLISAISIAFANKLMTSSLSDKSDNEK